MVLARDSDMAEPETRITKAAARILKSTVYCAFT